MTIKEQETQLIDDFADLGDEMLQYEYLLNLSCGLDILAEGERNEANQVEGCQSGVWMELSKENGRLHMRAYSDSLIVRGILAMIGLLLEQMLIRMVRRGAGEIANHRFRFLQETFLKDQLSAERSGGIRSVLDKILRFCK